MWWRTPLVQQRQVDPYELISYVRVFLFVPMGAGAHGVQRAPDPLVLGL